MGEIKQILLVNPPWFKEKGNIWRNVAGIVPPLGLASLAAVAERAGKNVRIIDAQALQMNEHETADAISSTAAGLVGFTATTPIVNTAYRLAKHARSAHPGAAIVFGGPHVTALPDEPFEHVADCIVARGEADITFEEIISSKAVQDIEGISYKNGESPVHNPKRPLVEDINTLPAPAYHLLPLDKYRPSLGNYRRLPALGIVATRGCYGRCKFCYRETFGNKVRALSADNVIAQLDMLNNEYGIRDVQFYDDIFLGDKRSIREFCEKMIASRNRVIWLCNMRAELSTPEILKLMRRAGCYMVDYGVESGSAEILDSMKKNAPLDRTIESIRMAQAAGIEIKCGFMIGSPGETPETVESTLKVSIMIAPDTAMYNITTPFPGTEIFKEAEENGDLLTRDWDLYDYSHVVLNNDSLPAGMIEDLYRSIYKRFYMRPAYIFGRLAKLRSPAHLSMMVRAFFVVLSLVLFEKRRRPA